MSFCAERAGSSIHSSFPAGGTRLKISSVPAEFSPVGKERAPFCSKSGKQAEWPSYPGVWRLPLATAQPPPFPPLVASTIWLTAGPLSGCLPLGPHFACTVIAVSHQFTAEENRKSPVPNPACSQSLSWYF